MVYSGINFYSVFIWPYKRVRIFEVFVEGAQEGFLMAIKLIPYLVGIYVAVGILGNQGQLIFLLNYCHQFSRLSMPLPMLCFYL